MTLANESVQATAVTTLVSNGAAKPLALDFVVAHSPAAVPDLLRSPMSRLVNSVFLPQYLLRQNLFRVNK